MTPQERLAYAARLLDEAGLEVGNVNEGISDAQVLVEVGRWQAVSAVVQAHIAVALAQHTSVLTTVAEHVVQNAEPWQRGEIRPCPGNMEHVAHRHYDDGLGEWWCPGLDVQLTTEQCKLHQNHPHAAHRFLTRGRRYWCPGIPIPVPQSCGERNNWPHEPHLYDDGTGVPHQCSGRSE